MMKITQLKVIERSGVLFFSVIFTNYCRLDILLYLLIKLALPILISQQVKPISDRVLATSGTAEGRGSKSS